MLCSREDAKLDLGLVVLLYLQSWLLLLLLLVVMHTLLHLLPGCATGLSKLEPVLYLCTSREYLLLCLSDAPV